LFAHAQTPDAIGYQGLLRDASGKVMANRKVSVKIDIRTISLQGSIIYSETQNVFTNDFGLYTLNIGRGNTMYGSIKNLPWGGQSMWVEVFTDLSGGNNYTSSGSSELISVPYALYADRAASAPTGATGPTGVQGIVGSVGLQGPAGSKGPTGPAGAPGKNGANGVNGVDGVNGTNGATGAVGPQGAKGPDGVSGIDGVPGATGPTGATGVAGKPNMTGTMGYLAKFSSPADASNSRILERQGTLGVNTSQPSATAIIDLVSSNQGVLLPRMTEAQRDAISNPATGLMIFNITTNCLNIRVPGRWMQECADCNFPAPEASNTGAHCEGDSLRLKATYIPGATYSWTGPNGFVSTDQNPLIQSVISGNTGTYSVTATLNGCTSEPDTTHVQVFDNPDAGFVFNPLTPQTFQSVQFIPNVTGATYFWSFTNGNPPSSTMPSPSVSWASVGSSDVTLILTANGCTSRYSDVVNIVCPSGSQTFSQNCTPQPFVVPDCVTSIDIDAYGAEGGKGTQGAGGLGARVQCTLQVTPGETLYVTVGAKGSSGNGAPGGCNGGGNGAPGYVKKGTNYYGGGGGGGGTDIRRGGTDLGNRIIVAGGGGGGSTDACTAGPVAGGAGGTTTGGDGAKGNQCGQNPSGTGGMQATGGMPGQYNGGCNATAGTFGNGGNANTAYCGGNTGGAGGGGGWYGGGGGGMGAGGGGSSYVMPTGISNVIHTQGANSGDGQLIITW
jgi:hypothetical protein